MLLQMAPEPTARRYYVSLGDSMSIDAYAGGPGRGAASLLYKNRDEDFPEWVGRDLATRRKGTRLVPLAMDGATSATVRYAQIPRLREMKISADVVTVTLGGNDLIQTLGSDESARRAHRELRENTHAVLAELRAGLLAPGAPVVVGTVYDPSDGAGNPEAVGGGMGAWPVPSEWIARFNETLRQVAAEQGAIVADLHACFLGHGLPAGAPGQQEARPANRELWYWGGIEPNAWGASAIRGAFWDALFGEAGPWKEDETT